MEIMTVPRELWYLPRPRRKDKYKGGFPAHFEKKLFELYGWPANILQPFGGMAEYGIRVDINPDVNPDYIGDAHKLDMFDDSTFDFVLCDPPYSTDLSGRLYNTGGIRWGDYTKAAVRVCKVGGYVGLYHWVMQPRPPGTAYDRIIVIITRIKHFARFCCVFKKI